MGDGYLCEAHKEVAVPVLRRLGHRGAWEGGKTQVRVLESRCQASQSCGVGCHKQISHRFAF